MIRWLRTLLGLGETDDEPDFSEYSLYDIGHNMCRCYETGTERNTVFQKKSMQHVLGDYCDDVEGISRDMVLDLDCLLEESVEFELDARNMNRPLQSKVHDFRRKFFDNFSEEEIQSLIRRMYMTECDRFALREIVEEMPVDGHEFRYPESPSMSARVAMESESVPVDVTSQRERSVEMKKVASRFDLCKSNLDQTMRDLVEMEAQMLWNELDINVPEGSRDIVSPEISEAIYEVQDSMYDGDMLVQNGTVYDTVGDVYGLDTVEDGTGVMDVSFVVADSSSVGYRCTAEPLSVSRPDSMNPYLYRTTWRGNYVVVNEDAVSGPV